MIPTFPLSDSSIIIHIGESIDSATNRRVHLLAAALALDPLPGILETVPGYATLTIHYDPLILTHSQAAEWIATQTEIATQTATRPAKTIEIPVTYDGPDLAAVAETCRLTPEEIIRQHKSTPYTVYMMGFTPGFPYLGILPEAIRVPRRPAPRPRVPAGSVAIAGMQTGIYPVDSPGGWQLIGHTDLTLFDPNREQPFLFAPGDMVQFVQLPDA